MLKVNAINFFLKGEKYYISELTCFSPFPHISLKKNCNFHQDHPDNFVILAQDKSYYVSSSCSEKLDYSFHDSLDHWPDYTATKTFIKNRIQRGHVHQTILLLPEGRMGKNIMGSPS